MGIEQDYIKSLWNERAIMVEKQPITLKSGRQSHVYINHRNFICLPKNMEFIVTLFEQHFETVWSQPFAICNVHSSVSPLLLSPISIKLKRPFYFYRPVSGEKGVYEDIFKYYHNPSSTFPKNLPAMLIDDVVTTMDTVKTASQSLIQTDIDVLGCTILVDRRVKSEKREKSIKISPIVNLAEILEYGIDNLNLDKEDKKLLEIELQYLEM